MFILAPDKTAQTAGSLLGWASVALPEPPAVYWEHGGKEGKRPWAAVMKTPAGDRGRLAGCPHSSSPFHEGPKRKDLRGCWWIRARKGKVGGPWAWAQEGEGCKALIWGPWVLCKVGEELWFWVESWGGESFSLVCQREVGLKECGMTMGGGYWGYLWL